MSKKENGVFGNLAEGGRNGNDLKKLKDQMQTKEFNDLAKVADGIFSEMFDDKFFASSSKGLKVKKGETQEQKAREIIEKIKASFKGNAENYEHLKMMKGNKNYIYNFCLDQIDVRTMSATFRKALMQKCNQGSAEKNENENSVPETLEEKKNNLRKKIETLDGNEAREIFVSIYGPEENIFGKQLYSKTPIEGFIIIKDFIREDKTIKIEFHSNKNTRVNYVNYADFEDKILDKYVLSKNEFEEAEKERIEKEERENQAKNLPFAEFESEYKDILGADLFNDKEERIHLMDYNERKEYPVKLRRKPVDSEEEAEYYTLEELKELLKTYKKPENPKPENPEKKSMEEVEKIFDSIKGEKLKLIDEDSIAGKLKSLEDYQITLAEINKHVIGDYSAKEREQAVDLKGTANKEIKAKWLDTGGAEKEIAKKVKQPKEPDADFAQAEYINPDDAEEARRKKEDLKIIETEKMFKEAVEHFTPVAQEFVDGILDEEKVDLPGSTKEERKNIARELAKGQIRYMLEQSYELDNKNMEKFIKAVLEKTKI